MPLTQNDYERISGLSPLAEKETFRPLRSSRENLQAFTHTLEKRENGTCEFLSEENLCKIHQDFGIEAKPSICRLFPYTFTVTPDAVLASLSFASTAVLSNSGSLLSDQIDTLTSQYELYKGLFKPNAELWQSLQLIDGEALPWRDFKKLDDDFSELLYSENCEQNKAPTNLAEKLRKFSEKVQGLLKNPSDAEKEPRLESRPKIVDQILLKHLERLYFPADVFKNDKYDLDARAMLGEMVAAPQSISFGQGKEARKYADLISIKLSGLAPEIEELIDRFLYLRFFSKLFFGPGFHHLSLLAGLHHLTTLHVILRLKIKQWMLLNDADAISFLELAELLRKLERRLTQLDLSAQSQSMLEVLLCSPVRQQRILFLSA
ncbi:MAG: YkgJ family cysteine cluster protein [Candidatus Obscuribacterales bacterium]|nr:YkgJ family cysteine cluster protein [Candidatus Obscuribacterales bacterium]